mmetsp:Transcript_9484/g.16519  ORF Transcript_9484/g.16519 Transcript_9484/m.16519 type:complete len:498 (+) Transcript_9484:823-2316(+)
MMARPVVRSSRWPTLGGTIEVIAELAHERIEEVILLISTGIILFGGRKGCPLIVSVIAIAELPNGTTVVPRVAIVASVAKVSATPPPSEGGISIMPTTAAAATTSASSLGPILVRLKRALVACPFLLLGIGLETVFSAGPRTALDNSPSIAALLRSHLLLLLGLRLSDQRIQIISRRRSRSRTSSTSSSTLFFPIRQPILFLLFDLLGTTSKHIATRLAARNAILTSIPILSDPRALQQSRTLSRRSVLAFLQNAGILLPDADVELILIDGLGRSAHPSHDFQIGERTDGIGIEPLVERLAVREHAHHELPPLETTHRPVLPLEVPLEDFDHLSHVVSLVLRQQIESGIVPSRVISAVHVLEQFLLFLQSLEPFHLLLVQRKGSGGQLLMPLAVHGAHPTSRQFQFLQAFVDILHEAYFAKDVAGITDFDVDHLLLVPVRAEVTFGGDDEFFDERGGEGLFGADVPALVEEVEFDARDAVDEVPLRAVGDRVVFFDL